MQWPLFPWTPIGPKRFAAYGQVCANSLLMILTRASVMYITFCNILQIPSLYPMKQNVASPTHPLEPRYVRSVSGAWLTTIGTLGILSYIAKSFDVDIANYIWSSDSSCLLTICRYFYTLLFNFLLCSLSNSVINASKSVHLCPHFLLIHDPKDINVCRTTAFIASHIAACGTVSDMLKSKKFLISVSIPSMTSLLESSAVFSLQYWCLGSGSCRLSEQETQAWSLHSF